MTKNNYYAKPIEKEKIAEESVRIYNEIELGAHFIIVKTEDLPDLFKADMKSLLGVAPENIISGVKITKCECYYDDDYTVVMLPKESDPETCADIFFKYAKTANTVQCL